jgi:hypothetical protein
MSVLLWSEGSPFDCDCFDGINRADTRRVDILLIALIPSRRCGRGVNPPFGIEIHRSM